MNSQEIIEKLKTEQYKTCINKYSNYNKIIFIDSMKLKAFMKNINLTLSVSIYIKSKTET